MQAAKKESAELVCYKNQSSKNTEIGERFNRTLFAAVDALEEKKIHFAVIGGVASSGLGRPRSTHDIDIFVSPDDADYVLEALENKGFVTEKTDPNWLYKAFKENILVDIIFKSRGDIYFDKEMYERAVFTEYHGRQIKVVAPEDLAIIKCIVHDEVGPHHWHDALSILSHAIIDWDYLLKRARRAPRRLLSLLLYAQSNDILVPNLIIFQLFKTIFYNSGLENIQEHADPVIEHSQKIKIPDPYMIAHIQDRLAHDPQTCEQDVSVRIEGQSIILLGEVTTNELRKKIEIVVKSIAEEWQIDNQIAVVSIRDIQPSESVQ